MATSIENLNAAVSRNRDVKDSVILAFKGQLDIIKNAGTEEERTAAIAALEANTDALVAAVLNGTPVQPSERRGV